MMAFRGTQHKGTADQLATLSIQMDAMAEYVANGQSVQEAGRSIGVDRNRACKVWQRIRERLGEQAR